MTTDKGISYRKIIQHNCRHHHGIHIHAAVLGRPLFYHSIVLDMPPPQHISSNNNNKCVPPEGKVYLTIGQDLFAVQAYLREQYNASLHAYMAAANASSPVPTRSSVTPAAFMVYTDLRTLAGLSTPTDYGSGVEYATGLADLAAPPRHHSETKHAPAVGLQVGLWLGGVDGCRAVLNGTWAPQVTQLVDFLGRTHHNFARVFLRIGYEFDNPSFGYYSGSRNDETHDPLYTRAYRVIVEACRQDAACARQTLFVWHSWAAGLAGDWQWDDFYPGDDVVDWIGISVFQQVYHRTTNVDAGIWSGGSYETLQAVLDYANRHDKPVMIAESTPFAMGLASSTSDHALTDPWAAWYQPVLDLIAAHASRIAMWSYIDCNWEAQPMWKHVGFGDTRVAANATVMRLWRQHVVENRHVFLGYGSLAHYCTADDYDTRTGKDGALRLTSLSGRAVSGWRAPDSVKIPAGQLAGIVLLLLLGAAWARRARRLQGGLSSVQHRGSTYGSLSTG